MISSSLTSDGLRRCTATGASVAAGAAPLASANGGGRTAGAGPGLAATI